MAGQRGERTTGSGGSGASEGSTSTRRESTTRRDHARQRSRRMGELGGRLVCGPRSAQFTSVCTPSEGERRRLSWFIIRGRPRSHHRHPASPGSPADHRAGAASRERAAAAGRPLRRPQRCSGLHPPMARMRMSHLARRTGINRGHIPAVRYRYLPYPDTGCDSPGATRCPGNLAGDDGWPNACGGGGMWRYWSWGITVLVVVYHGIGRGV